jgi:hypothetical protein
MFLSVRVHPTPTQDLTKKLSSSASLDAASSPAPKAATPGGSGKLTSPGPGSAVKPGAGGTPGGAGKVSERGEVAMSNLGQGVIVTIGGWQVGSSP